MIDPSIKSLNFDEAIHFPFVVQPKKKLLCTQATTQAKSQQQTELSKN